MSFGKNLQYLRRLCRNLTQEGLSEKLNVSRQTVSKWETDEAMPEMDKALELCKIFNCTLDNLFRDEMSVPDEKYSNLRIEMVKGFRYIAHTVLSTTPEDDALDRVFKYAKEWEIENPFVTIPGAYRTLMDYMKVNGWEHEEKDVIPCFETDGDTMDVYIACK